MHAPAQSEHGLASSSRLPEELESLSMSTSGSKSGSCLLNLTATLYGHKETSCLESQPQHRNGMQPALALLAELTAEQARFFFPLFSCMQRKVEWIPFHWSASGRGASTLRKWCTGMESRARPLSTMLMENASHLQSMLPHTFPGNAKRRSLP